MASIIQDIRYALRVLNNSRGFAGLVVLMMAIGIGVNTAVFSLANGILFRQLPVENAEELVRVGHTEEGQGFLNFSYPEYRYLRSGNDVFTDMLTYQPMSVSIAADGQSEVMQAEIVSGNYFSLLGVSPQTGRGFLDEEDITPGTHPVTVISDGLWRRLFGADPGVIGRSIRINGHSFTLVGVAPEDFNGTFVGFAIDLWIPVMMQEQVMPFGTSEGSLERMEDRFLILMGRLKDGLTIEDARPAMATLGRQLALSFPDTNEDRGIVVAPGNGAHPGITGPLGALMTLLMVVVGLVLLIACANVAGLLLARSSARRREIAIRRSLGAGRRRLIQQLLTESMILSIAGALAGLLTGVWLARFLMSLRLPTSVPISFDTSLDSTVLLFTLGASLLSGIVFGLVPALSASKPDMLEALDDGAPVGGRRRHRLRNLLVVGQVAVSLILLIGAGLLVRGLGNSQSIDPGFDADDVTVMSLEPNLIGYSPERGWDFYRDLLEGVSSSPGVDSLSLAGWTPLGDRGTSVGVEVEGRSPGPGLDAFSIRYNVIGPDYFETMRIPIVRGRDLTFEDRETSPSVALINETMAGSFWPGEDPLGKTFGVVSEETQWQVVGVVADSKYRSLSEPRQSYIYFPYIQRSTMDLTLHVRSADGASSVLSSIEAVLEDLDPELPVSAKGTLREAMAWSLVPARLAAIVVGTSGIVALLLAATGLYGLISFTTEQRTREIGVRMALGARRSDVLKTVIRQGMVLTVCGEIAGIAGALAATRILSNFLFGIDPADPLTFVGIVSLLGLVSLLACYFPAHRATRIDPMKAIRHE